MFWSWGVGGTEEEEEEESERGGGIVCYQIITSRHKEVHPNPLEALDVTILFKC